MKIWEIKYTRTRWENVKFDFPNQEVYVCVCVYVYPKRHHADVDQKYATTTASTPFTTNQNVQL